MSPGPRPAHGEAIRTLAIILDLVAENASERMDSLCEMLSRSKLCAALHTWLESQLRLQALAPQTPRRYQQALANVEILERLVADPDLHPARLTICRDMIPLLNLASAYRDKARAAEHRERLAAVHRQLSDLQELIQRAAERRVRRQKPLHSRKETPAPS